MLDTPPERRSSLDLNYRIDLPDADVRELIASEPRERNIHDLLEHDQVGYDAILTYQMIFFSLMVEIIVVEGYGSGSCIRGV